MSEPCACCGQSEESEPWKERCCPACGRMLHVTPSPEEPLLAPAPAPTTEEENK
jgi:hypothetical protein